MGHSCATHIQDHAQVATQKILSNAQIKLRMLEAHSDSACECKGVILFLEAILFDFKWWSCPFSCSLDLDFPVIARKEQVDQDLQKVMKALGLEAEGNTGWKLLSALSFCDCEFNLFCDFFDVSNVVVVWLGLSKA